jgi:hypothetical protein
MTTTSALYAVVALAIMLAVGVAYLWMRYARRPTVPQRRRADKLAPTILSILVGLVLIVGALAVVALANSNRSREALRVAEAARQQNEVRSVRRALGVCHRLQRLRGGQMNPAEAQNYYLAYLIVRLGSNPRLVHDFRTLLLVPGYGPPTQCEAATDHPLTYRPPAIQRLALPQACRILYARLDAVVRLRSPSRTGATTSTGT